MAMLSFARDRLVDDKMRPAVEHYARTLYAPVLARLGWGEPHAAPPRTAREMGDRLLRARLIGFLADKARDPEVRREAARRGRAFLGLAGAGADGALHRDVVSADLVGVALDAAAREGDAAFIDQLVARLVRTEESVLRGQLLGAITAVERPEQAARTLDLALDPRLRANERLRVVQSLLATTETRELAWAWLRQHLDQLVPLLPSTHQGRLPGLVSVFCDAQHAEEARALFAPRASQLPGGPRNLAHGLESIALCAARVEAQADSARAFFAATGKTEGSVKKAAR
jgi:alanyl aminopeptidase